MVLYDGEGRLLKAEVVSVHVEQKILGIPYSASGEQVRLSDLPGPAKPEELKAEIVTFLTAANVESVNDYSKEEFIGLPLDELIKVLATFLKRSR